MKNMLIVTTKKDLSIPLFSDEKVQKKIQTDFFFFNEKADSLKEKLVMEEYDYIYIRDPFNDIFDKEEIEKKVKCIFENKKNAYIIDNLNWIEDIYFEDKWLQYQEFPSVMPETKILTNIEEVDADNVITKKRISSRARGIFFDSKEVQGDRLSDYIIQDKVKIDKEYRVYVIFDEIIEEGTIKTSKDENSKVKVIGVEALNEEIINFVKRIIKENKFDFIGLDIVRSGDEYYLLEINRSCLFNGYFRESKVNLAEVFVDKLLKRNL